MYLEYFSLKEKPFSISPDPRFLFMSNRYKEALTHLTYGVQEGGGFVLLTGEVGTGKTTVCRCLLQQLPENTRLAFVLNPKLNSQELLATMLDELDVDYPKDTTSLKVLTDRLSEYLLDCYQQDLNVVVMIDEAQNLETDVLEQIRLLTNLETNQKKLLQIILVGQPELQEKLGQRELRQLAQRITARYHLRPLNLKETIAYILHRTRIAGTHQALFSRQAAEYLHGKTQGIPRLINTICDRALLAAATRSKKRVDRPIMVQAVREVLGDKKTTNEVNVVRRNWIKPAAVAAGFVLVAATAYWAGQSGQETELTASANSSAADTIAGSDKSQNLENAQQVQRSVDAAPRITQTTLRADSPTLAQSLIGDQAWDYNGRRSFASLLQLWQLEYSPIQDGEPCDYAASYGLKCNQVKANWQTLRQYNRPALLKFSAGLQGEFFGLLKSLKGARAEVVFGDKESLVGLDKLSTIWTGDAIFLWQAPQGFIGDIKVGDQGQAVVWLSRSLNALNQKQQEPQQDFDESLRNKVVAYQARSDIQADGIAGMQTILKINAETLNGIPLLESLN